MKKIFLGLLVVPAIAFGMEEKAAHGKNQTLIDAMGHYNDASAAARIAEQDTLPIKLGAMAVTCCLMSLARDNATPTVVAQACAGSCCCGIMAEGYSQAYAFGQRRARTNLLRVIHTQDFDATVLNSQGIQTWAKGDSEIQRAIIDRNAINAAKEMK